jgi:soluble lytic murein transglycosylase
VKANLTRLAIGLLVLALFCSDVNVPGALAVATPQPTAVTSLDAAQMALFNGDYATAAILFAAAAGTPDLKCSALYELGVTKLRAVQYPDADAALTRAITECPPTFQSYALRGDVRRTLGQNDSALADYQKALELKPGVIDSYLYERMASVSTDQGIGFLAKAAAAPRAPAGQVALRQNLIAAYKALGNISALEDQYTTLLGIATSPDALASAEEALGELQIDHNAAEKGYAHLQHVIATYPSTKGAFDALLTLVTAGQEVDLLVRTRINILNQNYRPVINKLIVYLPTNATDKNAAELYILLGKAQRGTGAYTDAIATFQKVRDNFPKDPFASTAALEQGITYETQNDEPNVLKAYADVVNAYPNAAEAPRALWRAASFEQSLGHTAQAVTLYTQLANSYAGTDLAKTGQFATGMLLSTTDPARAADAFAQADSTEGFLWQAKMLQLAHKDAQPVLTKTAALEPGTFFSLRAGDLLGNSPAFAPPKKLTLPTLTDNDRAQAETWAKTQFKLSVASTVLPPTLLNDQILARGMTLWDLGWWAEANSEFDLLYSLHRDDPASLLPLAAYYASLGVYRSSIGAASRLVVLSGLPIAQIPRYLAYLAYPIYYPDLLVSSAQGEHVDPLFVATIVRTESRFDPHATGAAGDTGLMQMIPVTGDLIATQLGVSDFVATDLYRPTISLKFGSHYLRTLAAALNGSLAPTVVAYNAGLDYSTRLWLTTGADVDRFYEQIDLGSVQNYLSYAYEQYAVYRTLYGG